jgi:hypothetical protein
LRLCPSAAVIRLLESGFSVEGPGDYLETVSFGRGDKDASEVAVVIWINPLYRRVVDTLPALIPAALDLFYGSWFRVQGLLSLFLV